MIVTLAEMKKYLRVDYADENSLIKSMIETAENMCVDIMRTDSISYFSEDEQVKTAVMYATAYLYEHREEADHRELMLTLRAMLLAKRGDVF